MKDEWNKTKISKKNTNQEKALAATAAAATVCI